MAKITQDIGGQERLVQEVTPVQQNVFEQSSKEMREANDFNRLLDLFPSIAGVVDTTIKLESQKVAIEQNKQKEIERQANLAIAAGVDVEQIADPKARRMVSLGYEIEAAGKKFLDDTNNGAYDELDTEAYRSVWMQDVGNAFINEKQVRDNDELAFVQLKMADYFGKNNATHTTRNAAYEEQQTKVTAQGEVLSLFQDLNAEYKNAKAAAGDNWTQADEEAFYDKAGKLIVNMPKALNDVFATLEKNVNFKNADTNNLMLRTMQTMVQQGMPVDLFIEGSKTPYETGNYLDKDSDTVKNKASFFAANSVEIASLRTKDELKKAELDLNNRKAMLNDINNLEFAIENGLTSYAELDYINQKWSGDVYKNGFQQSKYDSMYGQITDNIRRENGANSYVAAISQYKINGNEEYATNLISQVKNITDPKLVKQIGMKNAHSILGGEEAANQKLIDLNLSSDEWTDLMQNYSATGYIPEQLNVYRNTKNAFDPNFKKSVNMYNLSLEEGFDGMFNYSNDEHIMYSVVNSAILNGATDEDLDEIIKGMSAKAGAGDNLSYVDEKSEITSLVDNQYEKFDRRGILDEPFYDPDLFDATQLKKIVTDTAFGIYVEHAKNNQPITFESAVDKARKITDKRAVMITSNKGVFTINKNYGLYIPPGYKKDNKGNTVALNPETVKDNMQFYVDLLDTKYNDILKDNGIKYLSINSDSTFPYTGTYNIVTDTGKVLDGQLKEKLGIEENTSFDAYFFQEMDKVNLQQQQPKNVQKVLGGTKALEMVNKPFLVNVAETLFKIKAKNFSKNREAKQENNGLVIEIEKSLSEQEPQPPIIEDLNSLEDL